MSLENHPACRTANKVAMLMRYVASTSDSESSDSVINEALLLTLELFQLCDLERISESLAAHCECLARVSAATLTSPQADQWTVEACDLIRSMGFHEKLIAVLGDKLHQWQFNAVSVSKFTQSLIRLASECSEATETSLAELAVNARSAAEQSDIDRFSLAVCGFAIVLACSTNVDHSGEAESSSDFPTHFPTLEALSCFGGHLVTEVGT